MALEFEERPAGWSDIPGGYAGLVKPAQEPERMEDEVIDEVIDVAGVGHPDADIEASSVGAPPPQVVEALTPGTSSPQPPPPAPPINDALAQIAQVITQAVSGQSAISQRRMGADQAAEILMGMLPEACVHAVRDRSFMTHSHPLEIMAGVLVQVSGQGLIGEMSLNPIWKDYLRSIDSLAVSTSASQGSSIISRSMKCLQCQAEFTADRDGQRYCCSGCGKIASGYKERYSHSMECKTPAAALVQQKRARDEAEMRARAAQEAAQQQQEAA